jgi:hypothetical protein
MSCWESANVKDEERELGAVPSSLRRVAEEFLDLHDARLTRFETGNNMRGRLSMRWDDGESFATFAHQAESYSDYHDLPSSWTATFGTYDSDEMRVLQVQNKPLRRWDPLVEFLQRFRS